MTSENLVQSFMTDGQLRDLLDAEPELARAAAGQLDERSEAVHIDWRDEAAPSAPPLVSPYEAIGEPAER